MGFPRLCLDISRANALQTCSSGVFLEAQLIERWSRAVDSSATSNSGTYMQRKQQDSIGLMIAVARLTTSTRSHHKLARCSPVSPTVASQFPGHSFRNESHGVEGTEIGSGLVE